MLWKFQRVINFHYKERKWINLDFIWWDNTSSNTHPINECDSIEENKIPNPNRKVDKILRKFDCITLYNYGNPDKINLNDVLIRVSFDPSIILINCWFSSNFNYCEMFNLLWHDIKLQLLNFRAWT